MDIYQLQQLCEVTLLFQLEVQESNNRGLDSDLKKFNKLVDELKNDIANLNEQLQEKTGALEMESKAKKEAVNNLSNLQDKIQQLETANHGKRGSKLFGGLKWSAHEFHAKL